MNILQNKASYHPKNDKSYTFTIVTVMCFFVGMGLCVTLYAKTLINIYSFSKLFIGFTVVGFLIPLKLYAKWFQFIKYEIVLFNVIGMGPILTGLFLLINLLFTSSQYTHKYKIEKIYLNGVENVNGIGVILENNIFSHEPKIVELKDDDKYNIHTQGYFKITLATGFFGYEVIKNRAFVK